MLNETNDFELRFSRHILLDHLDADSVKKIQASNVLMIGAGGLGCPAAQYLVASIPKPMGRFVTHAV